MAAGEKAYQAGRFAEAERAFHEALQEAENFGPNDPRPGSSLNSLAMVYQAQGKCTAAEPLYTRALAIRERALGPDHPLVAASLSNLAGLYRATDRIEAAEELEQRAARIRATKR